MNQLKYSIGLDRIGFIWVAILVPFFLWLTFAKDFWYLSLVPLVILVAFYAGLSYRNWLMLLITVAPFSINLEETSLGGLGIALPTEPILFFLLVVVMVESLFKRVIDSKIWKLPMTKAILFYLLWIFLTSLTSTHFVVSLKYFIAKLWFLVPLYFLGVTLLRSEIDYDRFIQIYLWGMLAVALYSILHLAQYNFADKPSQWAMQPFFKDHTQLGAVYAMVIPLCSYILFKSKAWQRPLYFFMLVVFIIGLIVTFSRAALLSLIVGCFVWLLLSCRISPRAMATVLFSGLLVLLLSLGTIISALESNRQDSSERFVENVESVSNISTDASNIERLNRWSCAIDMFREKPIFGWGPGTYKFEYAPFQQSSLLTIISTDFGDVGNAHSEYLGPLCESGVLGLVSVLVLFTIIFFTGIRLNHKHFDSSYRWLIIAVTVALSTYFFHGLMNNFLDTEKVSIPFWSLVAILASLQIKLSKETQDSPST